ncbi:MAG: DinB family protein [Gemmatimonadales bacterium]
MNTQLEALSEELRDIIERAKNLGQSAGDLATRPGKDSWSAVECVEHLNITARSYVAEFTHLLARSALPPARDKYRMSFWGWVLTRMMEPPVKRGFPTQAGFFPPSDLNPVTVFADFERLHMELRRQLTQLAAFDLGRLRIPSPFNARIKYNLFSAFKLITSHARRHLWQAEQAVDRAAA